MDQSKIPNYQPTNQSAGSYQSIGSLLSNQSTGSYQSTGSLPTSLPTDSYQSTGSLRINQSTGSYQSTGSLPTSLPTDSYQSTDSLPINQSTGSYQSTGFLPTNQLINYTLHLADNALILGHRNSEWCGHGPVLEQDIAITNIALDLVGQARNFYQYAAELINSRHNNLCLTEPERDSEASPTGGGLVGAACTEDTLAYLRDATDFKNCLLVEQPNGDWGITMLRQFFFSTYQYYLYRQLQYSNDERIAAIAAKALKEVTYHVRWSSEWVIRLGTGTEESHKRMLNAISKLQQFTGELFTAALYETAAATESFGVDVALLKPVWQQDIINVFEKANLTKTLPLHDIVTGLFGKEGLHTENLYHILSEMQFLHRVYPGVKW